MPIEAALIKPVVDAVLALIKGGRGVVSRATAEKALQEALIELWKIDPNETEVEARIAIAKAAGIISSDLVHAEQRLSKVKAARKTAGAKKTAAKAAAAAKKTAAKKTAAKTAAKKVAAK
jgi:hypothetical protein